MFHIVIEQTVEYEKRMKYDPRTDSFVETVDQSLFFARGCPFPYGWLKESGTPPDPHLDAILVSSQVYQLGNEEAVRIIGCFARGDGDHKLVCVPQERREMDLADLSQGERASLFRLYPRVLEEQGEGWFGAELAKEIVDRFLTSRGER